MTNVTFKISAELKNIIGRDLITDDFIAVFELVKNAFDANAREVEIIFEGLKSGEPRIIIKDNGDGMNEDDLRNKWLFVAYSAKKLEQSDYRDKIVSRRIYAGAKGIGRFSCDRLGKNLKLTTRKKGESNWHVLDVDWTDFEENPQQEFQTVKANLTKSKDSPFPSLKKGTTLEISGLRNTNWDRENLLKLRQSLERLVNPNQGNNIENFSIILNVPDEKEVDQASLEENVNESWRVVNGPIKNFLFEALGTKTTQIQLEIDKEGKNLFTRLTDRGTLIYFLTEKNPFPDILQNIQITLFYLDRSAKLTFHQRMGLPSVQYGSIFLYKNGFRIHPYGDARTDSLGLDRRKQQGYNRYLGSRELSGRIEINGFNPEFRETSSRDGGLINNAAYESLIDLLFKYALIRLESYVVDLRRFGSGVEDLDTVPGIKDASSNKLRNLAFDLIVKLTKSKDVIDIRYDSNVLNILENRSAESVTALLKNLKRISSEYNNDKVLKEINRAEKQVKRLAKAKEEAEAETEKEREKARKAEERAREVAAQKQEAEEVALKAQKEAEESKRKVENFSTQNLFLTSALSTDIEHIIELHHSIKQDARIVEQFSFNLLSLVKDENKHLKREEFQAVLERINYLARKILTTSRLSTRANFRGDAEEISADLVAYIKQYLLVVYGGFEEDPYKQKISIQFDAPKNTKFETQFAPINVSIVFDNLIGNSRKQKTKNINVNVVECGEDTLIISFKDDGKGIPRKDVSSLFQIGFTTTDGSGLGLYHSRKIMNEMDGSILFNEDSGQGAEFILTFKKK